MKLTKIMNIILKEENIQKGSKVYWSLKKGGGFVTISGTVQGVVDGIATVKTQNGKTIERGIDSMKKKKDEK